MSMHLRTFSRLAVAIALATTPALAQDGRWKFSVGAAYVGGLTDITDYYEREHNVSASTVIPVGVMFTPYYEMKNGLRLGGDLGPITAVMGDVDFWDIPIGVSAGYAFLPSQDVSPYVRAGVRHHIASGTDVDGSTPGVLLAAGVDFSMIRRVRWGFEAAVDSASVDFVRTDALGFRHIETIKPHKFLVGVHVTF